MADKYPGEMPCKAPGDSPQVSDDPDVNRTMNLVSVLTLIIDIKKLCQC